MSQTGYTGLHIPQVLTEDAMKDLLAFFTPKQGEVLPLAMKYVTQIMAQANEIFRAVGNVVRLKKPRKGERITVVGDLHGQMNDILHILEKQGMPSQVTPV